MIAGLMTTRRAGAVLLAGLLLGVAGCGDDDTEGAPDKEAVNPLTGQTGGTEGPVAVVKIDNTPSGRPQSGLNDADVVYLEQVEGGQTRLAAVFATNRPDDVYPVRSARETDVELLAQYGSPILIFSGANTGVLDTINSSDLVPVSEDANPDAFGSVEGRVRPYQTSADVAAIAEDNPDASGVKDVGFLWDSDGDGSDGDGSDGGDPGRDEESPAPDAWSSAVPTASWSVSMGDVTAGFTWDEASGAWVWSMNGKQIADAADAPIVATNVIVQYVTIEPSKYVDATGAPTPYTDTVGAGAAVVFREGKRLDGEWSRPDADQGTVFRTADGTEIPLTPGGVWVLLAPEGNAVTAS